MTNSGIMGVPLRVAETIRGWARRIKQRRALADLDDRLLEDVGITRSAAAVEANKPFWK
jgi:uncharacterized protein YjiS (DUF1127 family)